MLRCEKARWHPPPRVSIAGREGDGRLRPPNPRSKTAEESLLRRFGRFALGDRGIPRRWVAKKREGARLPGCLLPVGTAMDASNVAKSGAEPRGSVFPAFVHRFRASIASSHRAVSRNARGEPPSPPISTAVESDQHRFSSIFPYLPRQRTHLRPFHASGVATAPRSRRSPEMSRSAVL